MVEPRPPLIRMPVSKARWKYWCLRYCQPDSRFTNDGDTHHHSGLEHSTGEHSQGNGGTFNDWLRLGTTLVGLDKVDENSEELGLNILRDIVADFEEGSDDIRATICPKQSNPQRGRVGPVLELVLPSVLE